MVAALSVIRKLPYHVRKYPTLSATPGRSSCCSDTDVCQLYCCLLKPSVASFAKRVPALTWPKPRSFHGPHSPLPFRFRRSQSGTKFPVRGSPGP